MDDSGLPRGGGFEWEEAEDITALSQADLRDRLEGLCDEERAISYRRRVLHGRIDLIRAELVQRGAVAVTPEDLARALLGASPSRERR